MHTLLFADLIDSPPEDEDEGGDRLKQCKLLINLSNLSNKLVPVSSSYDVMVAALFWCMNLYMLV